MPAPQGYIQRHLEQDKPKDENSHFFYLIIYLWNFILIRFLQIRQTLVRIYVEYYIVFM